MFITACRLNWMEVYLRYADINTTKHNSTYDKNEVSIQTKIGEKQKSNKVKLKLPTDSPLISKVSVENEFELCGRYIMRNGNPNKNSKNI